MGQVDANRRPGDTVTDRPLRPFITVPHYHPAYSFGGSVTKAVALASGLAHLGNEVTVVTSSAEELGRRPPRRTSVGRVNGAAVHYLGTWLSIGKSPVSPGVIGLARRMLRGVDVVFVIGLFDCFGVVVGHFARRYRILYVLEPSGMLMPIVTKRLLKHLYYYTLVERRLVGGASAVVVTSRREREDALRFGLRPNRLVLRRNGVALDTQRCMNQRGKFKRALGIGASEPLILCGCS